jgi:hypothetical protein
MEHDDGAQRTDVEIHQYLIVRLHFSFSRSTDKFLILIFRKLIASVQYPTNGPQLFECNQSCVRAILTNINNSVFGCCFVI